MSVREIANDPITASKNDAVSDCAKQMSQRNVGSLVVEDDGKVAGILTDRQIALATGDHDGNLSDVTTEEIMTEGMVTLQEDEDSLAISRTMAEKGVRRLPIVDSSDSLVGVVSLDDVVSLVGEQLADASTIIEKQSPGYEP
ncbi:CBS domain-containing protein [Halocatena pleomorpha]|uniref:CBS domain-containing protein n=1 Tax=Halocatena pleomorpha TaxID=1785090 RepID=A0A3P3RKC7_9EURY|nr:CBS domain-containing protein [Halocatena pleomorpha]RRJ33784.1 CBS domain-containing protein [Halocatena pleomorpha]